MASSAEVRGDTILILKSRRAVSCMAVTLFNRRVIRCHRTLWDTEDSGWCYGGFEPIYNCWHRSRIEFLSVRSDAVVDYQGYRGRATHKYAVHASGSRGTEEIKQIPSRSSI